MNQTSIYSRLTRFLLPLAVTLFVVELGIQVLSAGMARVPRATETLAAYGVAWGLIQLFTSPLTNAKVLSLVMADSPGSRQKVQRFIVAFGFLLMLCLASLALTPISHWVIEGFHSVSSSLGDTVRQAILWLIPAPLVTGMAQYYTGQLLRARRTIIVSLSSIASISAGILLVFLLLPTPWIQANPIFLPILATYVNLAVDITILSWANSRLADRPETVSSRHLADTEQAVPTYGAIIRFIWPLAMNISFQEFSRPLINIFLARGTNGVEALAVLTVVYAVGQFPFRWLNDLRNLATAFQDEPNSLYHVKRFSIACGFVSLLMMLGLFWTPLAGIILQKVMGLEADFAARAHVPLMIFVLFSPIVTLRSYAQGIVLLEKRTHIIAYCAPTRLTAVWLTLITLPHLGLAGATLGVSALAAGFFIESMTMWWGVYGVQLWRGKGLASTSAPS